MSDAIGTSQHYLQGGTPIPAGEYQAVGRVASSIGGCTGTLITNGLVLTAAHCMCPTSSPNGCVTRATFTLVDVLPVGGGARTDVGIAGDVRIFPFFGAGGSWLLNDFALVQLDSSANSLVRDLEPIPVELPTIRPQAGDSITLVGFGRTGNNCNSPSAGKMRAVVEVDSIDDITMRFNNSNTYACPGDSGGPAINERGYVVGVASSGNFAGNSNYDPTYLAYSWIYNTTAILQTTGVVNFLRVHDVNTGFGPPADPVSGEVVVGFGNRPSEWFGFELRTGSREPKAAGMFALLRESYVRGKSVRIDYQPIGPTGRKIVRVIRS
jgi:hypothetical protein